MFRLLWAGAASAVLVAVCVADDKPTQLHVNAAGLKREALVYPPSSPPKAGAPVVFVFHGHGSSAKIAAKEFAIHEHWHEAICVYMQGVPTATKSDPKGKEAGWQTESGEVNDRDLKFFDEMLTRLQKDHKVNEKRVFVAGFSNGSRIAMLLWGQRGDVIAGIAGYSAISGEKLKGLKPKPCLIGCGEKEPSFESHKKLVQDVRKLNGCDADGDPWPGKGKGGATLYPSKNGTPVVWAPHSGDHEVPDQAGRLITRFFKENSGK